MDLNFINDLDLINALKKGDSKAYTFLVNNYHHRLCVYAFTLSNDHDLSEDIVQNVFMSVWKNKHKLKDDFTIKSYLYKSVYNEFIDQYRKQKSVLALEKKHIDDEAILNADYIIHLAGAGIADKRWTKSRKKQLIASRVDSTNLLFEKVKELNPNLKGFISASGIGFYGAITSKKIFQENDAPNNDFLSKICILWEKEVYKFKLFDINKNLIFNTNFLNSNCLINNYIIKPTSFIDCFNKDFK